jgi:hypothetical protein
VYCSHTSATPHKEPVAYSTDLRSHFDIDTAKKLSNLEKEKDLALLQLQFNTKEMEMAKEAAEERVRVFKEKCELEKAKEVAEEKVRVVKEKYEMEIAKEVAEERVRGIMERFELSSEIAKINQERGEGRAFQMIYDHTRIDATNRLLLEDNREKRKYEHEFRLKELRYRHNGTASEDGEEE